MSLNIRPFIKLYQTSTNSSQHCLIQVHTSADYSNKSLAHLKEMVKDLKKSFKITDCDIEIEEYTKGKRKGQFYIQAYMPFGTKKPKSYIEVSSFVEYIANHFQSSI